MIRSDRGKENLVVGQMQIAYQVRQLGEQAWQAFRMGTSVHNQVVFVCLINILTVMWIFPNLKGSIFPFFPFLESWKLRQHIEVDMDKKMADKVWGIPANGLNILKSLNYPTT